MSSYPISIDPRETCILWDLLAPSTGIAVTDTEGQPRPRALAKVDKSADNTVSQAETMGSRWVAAALKRLEKVASLPDDWDGEGSPATDPEIVIAALDLIDRLVRHGLTGVPAPFVCPIAGGGLQFEWTSPRRHLEIEFVDKQTLVFLRWDLQSGEEPEADELPVTAVQEVRELIEWFARG